MKTKRILALLQEELEIAKAINDGEYISQVKIAISRVKLHLQELREKGGKGRAIITGICTLGLSCVLGRNKGFDKNN